MLLSRQAWQTEQEVHHARAAQWVEPHLERRRRGEKHAVWDFLFDYYRLRPNHLYKWHPGVGRSMADASEAPQAHWRDYLLSEDGTVTFDAQGFVERRYHGIEEIHLLLSKTIHRTPQFDCFGLHEWAMVYHDEAPRHDLPLRLGPAGTDAVVDKHRLKCTHYDAYRFFTKPALPLNLTVLKRETQAVNDQPGCVHVSMDLYKWAVKMGPLVPGDLLLDCFELAVQARKLDMEASPYDCRALGFEVVPIETPEGKTEYVHRQRKLTRQATRLRERLLNLLDSDLFQIG
ncbi:3-methyladenine DNA glycosylase [Corynebacterium breve]|uniref:3-methyladenine DNA glycosylase n=1 Tax=Corynebacterium breve TaxID=3049799 RepID=A0ABY8VIL6_9CORY|nr:3-methyladenine DNA glycosylase [Corynebacterium breve]WIM68811.1 3-methyladenine DNA glycosylase [Corynebacterium breve]